ncbi:MAG TPA: hypothetical protein VHW72_01660 [Candidatus Angelobacter sp.]|jgi:hypothetical protein|nr:hypothetical protein [Candidatus Angelobacter sp.]
MAEILRGIERSIKNFPFGLSGDEGRERPTGGLADYRQVKPWKKRDIAEEIVRLENGAWQKNKNL